MHEKAELNAPKCWVMNGKGGVSGRQRGVECDAMGGKVRKKTDQKRHNGNNLAKLNDAKCIILCSYVYLMDI